MNDKNFVLELLGVLGMEPDGIFSIIKTLVSFIHEEEETGLAWSLGQAPRHKTKEELWESKDTSHMSRRLLSFWDTKEVSFPNLWLVICQQFSNFIGSSCPLVHDRLVTWTNINKKLFSHGYSHNKELFYCFTTIWWNWFLSALNHQKSPSIPVTHWKNILRHMPTQF